MEPRSRVAVDAVEEFGEELSAVVLVVVGGVVALLAKDGHELRSGLEKPAAFADALEGAVERDRSGAVASTGGQRHPGIR
jgi:hypothetical protein